MEKLAEELKALYSAFLEDEPDPLPALPAQYAEFSAWEKATLASTELAQEQIAYWKKALAGAPALLELPADRARPAQQDFAGASAGVVLDEDLMQRLRAVSKRHGVTLYVTLLAAWAVLLARLSGQQDVIIGSPAANRSRAEFEPLIGFFVNTLAMRIDLSGSPTVAELLARVKEMTVAAQQHQDVPFEQVVEALQPQRSMAYAPLFQVMFAWLAIRRAEFDLPGLRVASIATPHTTAQFDLAFSLNDSERVISGRLEYATSLFDRDTIERYIGYWKILLKSMAADDAVSVTRLPVLPDAERHKLLVELNATHADYPKDKCIHELFEAQAAKTPDAIAVVHEDRKLTYAVLNAKANRLAHYLRGLGVKPDARVAICVERSLDMMVGLLAILKAGGAYMPLDPSYPAERLAFMLKDSEPVVLLTQNRVKSLLAGCAEGIPIIDLEADASSWSSQSDASPDRAVTGLRPDHLAYVIYTSGSTGAPKGVMVEHRSFINHVTWQCLAFNFTDCDAFLQRTPISFDASVWELWTPLAIGARLILLPPEAAKNPSEIIKIINQYDITIVQFVPSLLSMLLRELGAEKLRCRYIFCGGEALDIALAKSAALIPSEGLVNLYGPTECTIDVTSWRCLKGEKVDRTYIGRPIANTQIYILDANLEPAPIGVAGEIYIGGAGVARGYLNRPELTAERFIADPFAKEPDARMYKTGDLGRWLPDGTIDFLGRNDFQVKIRGFRIELGEIEARLREHPGIHDAAVVAREDRPGDKRLAAYYVVNDTHEGKATTVELLRMHLAAALPEYMVPAAYVKLDRLPQTTNGKLDRNALPAGADAFAARAYEAPETGLEQNLAAIWGEIVNIERIGRNDDLISIGASSIDILRIATKANGAGIPITVRQLLKHRTVAKLAAVLEEQIKKSMQRSSAADANSLDDQAAKATAVLSPLARADGQQPAVSPAYDEEQVIELIEMKEEAGPTPILVISMMYPGRYYELVKHLGSNRPFLGLQLHDLSRPNNFTAQSIEEVAAQYVTLIRRIQPRGPYLLLGWCLGGTVAFEVAQQLIKQGEKISFLGIIDQLAPDYLRRLPAYTKTKLYLEEHWHPWMHRAQKDWAEVRQGKKSLGQFLFERMPGRIKSRLTRTQEPVRDEVENYTEQLLGYLYLLAQRYKPAPLTSEITVFISEKEATHWLPSPARGWDRLALGGVEIIVVPGDHFTIFEAPGAQIMASRIASDPMLRSDSENREVCIAA